MLLYARQKCEWRVLKFYDLTLSCFIFKIGVVIYFKVLSIQTLESDVTVPCLSSRRSRFDAINTGAVRLKLTS